MQTDAKEIGARVKELRTSHGMSQQDLADMLNTNRVTVLKWEKGESRPVRRLDELSRIFHVTTDYILTGRDKDAPLPAAPPTDELTREERDVVYKYRSLTPEMRRAVDALLSMPSTKGIVVSLADWRRSH